MDTIRELEFYEQDFFSMTKAEAMDLLQQHRITNSEAMLLRWCREGKIQAVRVTGRSIDKRGVYINPLSLHSFIASKKGSEEVEKLHIEIAQLKQEKQELQARIDYLENKYVKKKN